MRFLRPSEEISGILKADDSAQCSAQQPAYSGAPVEKTRQRERARRQNCPHNSPQGATRRLIIPAASHLRTEVNIRSVNSVVLFVRNLLFLPLCDAEVICRRG